MMPGIQHQQFIVESRIINSSVVLTTASPVESHQPLSPECARHAA